MSTIIETMETVRNANRMVMTPLRREIGQRCNPSNGATLIRDSQTDSRKVFKPLE
jgi:hypothetical protein